MKKEKLNKINVGIDDSTVYAESLKSNVGAGDSTVYAESVTSKSSNRFMCARPQKRNTQKGITLVALVITIIVMLLLSVVSINLIQNAGLIEKVKLSKEEHRASTIQEQKELFEKEIEISKYDGDTPKTINDLLNKLEEQKLITEEEKSTIKQTGRITIGSKEIIFSEDAILPDGYTRLEYLESTGTQYIDTGIKNVDTTKFTYEYDVMFKTNSYMLPSGCRSSLNTRLMWGVILPNIKIYQIGYGSTYKNVTIPNVTNKWITIKSSIENNKYKVSLIDDKEYSTTFGLENFNTIQHIYLFGCNNQGSLFSDYAFSGRLKNVKMFENSVLIQELIPTLDDNGVPCMYDTVSGQPFYNQGTGEFIAGPVVE